MSEPSAPPPAITLRPGTAADTDNILELVSLSLGEGAVPRNRAYWDWKHHLNPFGESPVLLGEADGQLVGLRVFMRWEWAGAGRSYRAVRAVDTATHPDWQGRGIFSRLTKTLVQRMAEDEVHFIFNTPNEKSRPGYLKMGWHSVGRTDLWIRALRPLRMLRGLIRHGSILTIDEAPVLPVADVRSLEELFEHPKLQGFLAAQADEADTRLTTPISPAYLRWRYQTIPGFQYGSVFELEGYTGAALIFRLKRQGPVSELRICEFLVGADRVSRRIGARLLGRLLSATDADYVSIMAAPRTAAAAIVNRRLFLPAKRLGPILTVRQLNAATVEPDPTSRTAWRASIGDLELF